MKKLSKKKTDADIANSLVIGRQCHSDIAKLYLLTLSLRVGESIEMLHKEIPKGMEVSGISRLNRMHSKRKTGISLSMKFLDRRLRALVIRKT